MVKPTKYCQLVVHLLSGERVAGRFHVEQSTSSTIRPSDALRQYDSGFILLTNVQWLTNPQPPEARTIMLSRNAIAMVELGPDNWKA